MKISALAVVFGLGLVGCSGPSGNDRVTLITPDRASFTGPSTALGSHCGTLDCHGSIARNLRIYSLNGLRLGGITNVGDVTDDEITANFESVVMLEPETLALVMRDGGRNPERLTIVRKGRGAEAHKGGTPMPFGSSGDVCLTSWIANAVNDAACTDAAEVHGPTP